LEADLAAGLLSLNGIKGVEVGLGFEAARRRGSESHDEFFPAESRSALPRRTTNRAGGLEGGITNGQPLVVRAAMKPISTLGKPLHSIDLKTGGAVEAHHERSDICAVPAASVVGEAIVALVLARAALAKFGGDHIADVVQSHESYCKRLTRYMQGNELS
jgi:chorismate synthase